MMQFSVRARGPFTLQGIIIYWLGVGHPLKCDVRRDRPVGRDQKEI